MLNRNLINKKQQKQISKEMMNNLAIAAIAGVASAKLLRPTINSQQIGDYNNFAGKFSRNAITHEEFEKRVGIFVDNQRHVDEVNEDSGF